MKNRVKYLIKLNGKTISRRSPAQGLKYCNLQITHRFWNTFDGKEGFSLNCVDCSNYNYSRFNNVKTLHEDTNRIFSEVKEFSEPKDGISIVEFFCDVNELNNLYASKFGIKSNVKKMDFLFQQKELV
jgi:hypothetical protein